eukprot:m.18406 g.18406  ORF g.18406 m.18406 type:complete len:278 (+) comp4957_c0_seq2:118-951(+)
MFVGSTRGVFRLVRPLVALAGGIMIVNNELLNKSAPKLAANEGAKRVSSVETMSIITDGLYAMKMNVFNVVLMVGSGLSAFSGGSATARNGVVIALPPTYFATSDPLIYQSIKASLNQQNGSLLAQHIDSFIPTDNARRFTILHELSHIKHSDSRSRALTQGATMMIGYEIWGRKILQSKTMPIPVKLGMTMVLVMVSFAINVSNWWRQELRADSEAASIDMDACIGGIDSIRGREHVEKVLKPTWKLKSLTHPPISLRKMQLEKIQSAHKRTLRNL